MKIDSILIVKGSATEAAVTMCGDTSRPPGGPGRGALCTARCFEAWGRLADSLELVRNCGTSRTVHGRVCVVSTLPREDHSHAPSTPGTPGSRVSHQPPLDFYTEALFLKAWDPCPAPRTALPCDWYAKHARGVCDRAVLTRVCMRVPSPRPGHKPGRPLRTCPCPRGADFACRGGNG